MKQTPDQNSASAEKPFLTALRGGRPARVPFWLMRQAGRYLPEYRDLRAKAGGFLDMVYNPSHAAEVTLQPLRRYGMDAAILFSDILVIPHALGQSLEFAEGEGPKLDPIRDGDDLGRLQLREHMLEPIYESVSKIRGFMRAEYFVDAALVGFAGAPWTVATYMVEGGSSREMIHVKSWAYRDPESFSRLIKIVTKATIHYLSRQVKAGAEAVQLFDSWAGVLDDDGYQRWVIEPAKEIVQALRAEFPSVPVIGFPRGSGQLYGRYAAETGVSALGLDAQVPLAHAQELQKKIPVQGNLDPVRLLAGGNALETSCKRILEALGDGPFVFNLGHGVIKETPPEHVAELARIIREWNA